MAAVITQSSVDEQMVSTGAMVATLKTLTQLFQHCLPSPSCFEVILVYMRKT